MKSYLIRDKTTQSYLTSTEYWSWDKHPEVGVLFSSLEITRAIAKELVRDLEISIEIVSVKNTIVLEEEISYVIPR